MTYDEIIALLTSNPKYEIIQEKNSGNSRQIKLNNGAIINCFTNGNHNVQGQNIQEIKDFLSGATVANRKVLVHS